MKKPEKPLPIVEAKMNEHDVWFIECPKCNTYEAPAKPGEFVCYVCGLKFVVRIGK